MPVVCFIGIFAYNFKNIVINKITIAAVDSKHTVCRHLVQCFFKVYFVEESNVAVEFDIIHFGLMLFGFGDLVFCFKIIADDKINGDEQPNANTYQQICKEDYHNSNDKGNELFPSKAPHIAVEFWFGKIISRNQ